MNGAHGWSERGMLGLSSWRRQLYVVGAIASRWGERAILGWSAWRRRLYGEMAGV